MGKSTKTKQTYKEFMKNRAGEGLKRLKLLLLAAGYEYTDIAKMLKKSPSYVSYRMTGFYAWNIEEIVFFCELLEIPAYKIPAYFFTQEQISRLNTMADTKISKFQLGKQSPLYKTIVVQNSAGLVVKDEFENKKTFLGPVEFGIQDGKYYCKNLPFPEECIVEILSQNDLKVIQERNLKEKQEIIEELERGMA